MGRRETKQDQIDQTEHYGNKLDETRDGKGAEQLKARHGKIRKPEGTRPKAKCLRKTLMTNGKRQKSKGKREKSRGKRHKTKDKRKKEKKQKTEVRSQKAKDKNTKYKIQNTKYKIQNTKYKIQNTKYKIQIQIQRERG